MAIVITLSNELASEVNRLNQFVSRGATRYRFNTSFSSPEIINYSAESLQKIGASLNQKIDVIIDLPGKKRRLGKLKENVIELAAGQVLGFCLGKKVAGSNEIIPIPEQDFLDLLEPGDHFFIKDGKIKFLITTVDSKSNCFTAQCLTTARVESFLGYSLHLKKLASLNLQEHDSDRLDKYEFRYINQIAVSYAESPVALEEMKKSLLMSGNKAEIIAKIETQAGFDKILELDKVCHELWFCRGDFANNVSVENLYHYEKKLLNLIPRLKSPVYVAGENMLGMVHGSLPSRAEISHLSYLFENGINGIVLSDETVKSENPLDAFLFAQKISKKYGHKEGILNL